MTEATVKLTYTPGTGWTADVTVDGQGGAFYMSRHPDPMAVLECAAADLTAAIEK